MRYDYDMLGTRIHQASMEAGERWMLNDVAGKPIRAWDSRGSRVPHRIRRAAPAAAVVRAGRRSASQRQVCAADRLRAHDLWRQRRDRADRAQQQQANLRGKVFQHFDGAGVVTTERYDFKGNLLRSTRQLAQRLQGRRRTGRRIPRSNSETFTSSTAYDALNRADRGDRARTASVYPPDLQRGQPAGEGRRQPARRSGAATPFVTNIDYNAKGQRTLIDYGNGARTDIRL